MLVPSRSRMKMRRRQRRVRVGQRLKGLAAKMQLRALSGRRASAGKAVLLRQQL
jgi:hypothetical protein